MAGYGFFVKHKSPATVEWPSLAERGFTPSTSHLGLKMELMQFGEPR